MTKVPYGFFYLKEVEIKGSNFSAKWEEKHPHDKYQGDYSINCHRSGNFALNSKIFDLMQDLQTFISTEQDNVRITKLRVSDFGDAFDTVQLEYETNLEDDKPTKIKEPKMELHQFGGLQSQLETKLEEIKLNCYEHFLNDILFRPMIVEAEMTESGEVLL